jgi:hypothetical protein
LWIREGYTLEWILENDNKNPWINILASAKMPLKFSSVQRTIINSKQVERLLPRKFTLDGHLFSEKIEDREPFTTFIFYIESFDYITTEFTLAKAEKKYASQWGGTSKIDLVFHPGSNLVDFFIDYCYLDQLDRNLVKSAIYQCCFTSGNIPYVSDFENSDVKKKVIALKSLADIVKFVFCKEALF